MSPAELVDPPPDVRRALLAGAVVGVVVIGGYVLFRLFTGGLSAPFDFTAFWVAGHLAGHGASPYDPALVQQTQRDLGMDDTAIIIWNPPWVLSLVMPVGALPFRAAYGAWVLLHLGLIFAAAGLLWRGFGGDRDRQWIAFLLALTFVPTIFLVGSGQITAVVLVGLAGFLVAARANRPLLAGAFAALTAAKPHLLALFAVWLVLEAVRDRFARRVVLGGAIVGLLACVPPTLSNPNVWADYLHAVTGPSSADHNHLSRWTPPLLGWWLRTAVPGQPFWVQWVPLLVGAAVFVRWHVKAARSVGGEQETPESPADRADRITHKLPWLVGLSLLIAPYGVWQHDLVLLLVPVLAVYAKLVARPVPPAVGFGVVWLAAANGVMLAMMMKHTSSEFYVWVVPTVLVSCLLTARLADRPWQDTATSLAPAGV